MTALPMTPFEKLLKAKKIATYSAGAVLMAFVVQAAIPSRSDGNADGTTVTGTKAGPDRPPRDDAFVVGAIPPNPGGIDRQPSIEVKRVQLPSPDVIRASLLENKKIAARPKSAEFANCLPKCETRDPLVGRNAFAGPYDRQSATSYAETAPQPQPLRPDRSILQRGGDFLEVVAEAPALTIEKGKQAFDFAGQLFQ